MSFLIPPTAYPARFGMLLTTLLVQLFYPHFDPYHLHHHQGAREHVHLGPLDDPLGLERFDCAGHLDPLHHPPRLHRPPPLHRRPDRDETGGKKDEQQRERETIARPRPSFSGCPHHHVCNLSSFLHNCICLNIEYQIYHQTSQKVVHMSNMKAYI